MNNSRMLHLIRELYNQNQIEDNQVSKFLWEQDCYHLLLCMPSERLDAISKIISNQMYMIHQYNECRKLFSELNEIPYALMKGAVLAKQIYPSVGYRKSRDIDILISPEYLQTTDSILKKNGFIQGQVVDGEVKPYTRENVIFQRAFTHQVASYVKKTDDPYCPFLVVDINHNVLWGEAGRCININDFLSNTVLCELFGIKTKKMNSIFEFVSLCLHHYKDLNSLYLLNQRGVRLSHFFDIERYVRTNPIDILQLREVCERYDVTDYITFCLYHTNILFQSDIISQYLNVFRTDNCTNILNRIGLEKEEYKTIDGGISAWAISCDFESMLNSMLTDRDKKKIKTNMAYRGILYDPSE